MVDQSPQSLHSILRHPLRFSGRVLSGFHDNKGFLLSGAIAYYMLLSIVPLFIVLLVILSHVIDQEQLLDTARTYLEIVVPGQSAALTEEVEGFLAHSRLVGVASILMLLFFSSWAFTALEQAMQAIFFHRVRVRRRHFLISAVIPYIYILAVGLGLFIVSVVSGALQAVGQHHFHALGLDWSLAWVYRLIAYLIGLIGQILLLTSLYMVMPVGRLAWRHALVGGVAAGLSWEITRHVLVWYFSTLSLVNVIYGSMATAIIILISFDIASIIILLGAQLIAEYERGETERRRPWLS